MDPASKQSIETTTNDIHPAANDFKSKSKQTKRQDKDQQITQDPGDLMVLIQSGHDPSSPNVEDDKDRTNQKITKHTLTPHLLDRDIFS